MTTGEKLDRAAEALSNSRRRSLLSDLKEKNPQHVEIGVAAEGDDTGADLRLVHVHLPKLEEYGYVSWDRETGEIVRGPDWEEVRPLLEDLEEHGEDLGGEDERV